MLGRTVFGTTGVPIVASADGAPELKTGALTIAWEAVAAVSSDTVTREGYTVPSGKKYLRFGQVMTKITTNATQTLQTSGTPTGGSFSLNVYNPLNGSAGTVTLNYNDNANTVKTAYEAFYGSGNVGVNTGTLTTGTVTVTFQGAMASVQPPLGSLGVNALTGGTAPSVQIVGPTQTIAISGTPTGGKTTLTITNPATGTTSTQDVAYNATAATVQGYMDTLFGAGNTYVSGGALPGTSIVVGFKGAMASYEVAAFTATDALTGGTAPATAITASLGGGASGKFGPYDPNATDGRQTLTAGECFVLNESIVNAGVGGLLVVPVAINVNQVGGAIDGGRVWKERLVATSGVHSLAAGPTFTELCTAIPRLRIVEN